MIRTRPRSIRCAHHSASRLLPSRGGAIGTSGDSTLVTVMSWVIVAFMAINTAMNLTGKHWVERYVFGGMTVMLAVLCLIVALAGPS